MNGDFKYNAPTGTVWVCAEHMVTSENKFNGWPPGCNMHCCINAKLWPLIRLELKDKKVLAFRGEQ